MPLSGARLQKALFRGAIALSVSTCLLLSHSIHAQQEIDPFQDYHDFYDVSNEASDEAFFHLERFFQFEIVGGFGLFTGGLGGTHGLGGAAGFDFHYFLDNAFAIESGFWFSFQDNSVRGFVVPDGVTQNTFQEDSTTYLFVPNAGVRYYFNTAPLSRFLSLMNPYIVGGIEWVIRRQSVHASNDATRTGKAFSDKNFGMNAGLGVTSLVYGKSIYLGLDIRFHYLFLSGEKDYTVNFSRDGDYITIFGTFTVDY